MARAPGGARRRAAGCRRGGEAVRKGCWMAEEDAVLREHVHVHGPQDWSFLQSKGLLRRSGKSCRLRWLNKLRPDLKAGKFSAEEKSLVLDLQAKFGNKWAKIATFLLGRTDNDVKNFWSSHQKRLARLIVPSPRPGRSGNNLSAKATASLTLASGFTQGFMNQVPFEGSSSSGQFHAATPSMDSENAALVTYDPMVVHDLGSWGACLPALPAPDFEACSSDGAPLLARTDNEANNFWGTRQKRSGRLLRTPLLGESSSNFSITTAAASSLQLPNVTVKGPFLDPVPFEGSSYGGQIRAGTTFQDAQNSEPVPYDQTASQLLGFGGAQQPLALATDIQASSSNAASLPPPQLQLYQLPYPLLDLPGIGGSIDTAPGFATLGAMYDFAYRQELLPLFEPRGPSNHFDDLPPDLFDSADQVAPPSSPSSSRTISDK